MRKFSSSPLYTFLVLLLFLAAVSVTAAIAISSIEKETKAQIRSSLQTVLQITVTTYKTWGELRKKRVEDLAGHAEIIGAAEKLLALSDISPSELRRLREYMRPILAEQQDQGFFIISPDRINIASMRNSNLGAINLIHLQRQEHLDRAFNGETLFVPTVLSDVPLETSTHSIFILSPIKQEEEIIAVLALRISINAFFTVVTEQARLGYSGETYAFDKQGMLITKSRFDQQLRETGLISQDDNEMLNIRIADPGGNLLQGFVPDTPPHNRPLTIMARSATKGESGYDVDGYRDYRGVPVFGAWRWDHFLGFGITTELDVAEALRPYYKTRDTIISVIAITLILTLSLMAYALRIQQRQKDALKQAYDSLEQRVEDRTHELNQAREALESANQELEVLAITDSLTSLANRRCFDEHLSREWLHCRRKRSAIAIIMLDIDYFKNYNDEYGHLLGDDCLRTVSELLKSLNIIRRPGDLIARYGGEEFVIVLSDPTAEYVQRITESIRQHVYQLDIEHSASELPDKRLTVSIGYAVARDLNHISRDELVQRADKALYQAKQEGRNRVAGSPG